MFVLVIPIKSIIFAVERYARRTNIPFNVHTYMRKLYALYARIHKRNGRYIAEDEKNSEIRSSALRREQDSPVIEVLSSAELERNTCYKR